MSHQISRTFLALALTAAILAVSSASILIRLAQQEAPSLVVAATRLSIASLALAPLALTRHRAELQRLTRRELLLAAASGVFLAIHFATWISSLEYTSVASSVVLVSTGPLWVALLSPLFLHERLGRIALAGLILALIGGTIIALGDSATAAGGRAPLGNFLALAGAWAVTGYLMIGRRLRAQLSLVSYVFVVYGVASITLIVAMVAAGESPLGYSPSTYGWMILLALVPQLIGHSTYNWALRYLPAHLVAAATLGEPIGASILALVILREAPTVMKLAGGALILAGIYMASLSRPPAETDSDQGASQTGETE